MVEKNKDNFKNLGTTLADHKPKIFLSPDYHFQFSPSNIYKDKWSSMFFANKKLNWKYEIGAVVLSEISKGL